jgi:hypothetical protein
MADDITGYDHVEGYPDRLSYAPGEPVHLHVSCRSARFGVVVERWGSERVEVWRADDVAGVEHPTPSDADANGCGWPAGLAIPTDGWDTGFHLVTFTALDAPADRAVSHAGFVVRAPDDRARQGRALLVLATNTWNAYNSWGGCSLYTGGTQVSFRRPFGRGLLWREPAERDDRKARPVRWGEEPDAEGAIYQRYRFAHGYPGFVGSAGWFTFERRFVEWAEAAGFALDYAVSTDLDDQPGLLEGYDLVLGVGHDEYWSAPQRTAVEDHVRRGGNLASFSGNTCFWQVRIEQAGDTMVCHKYTAHETDPVVVEGRAEAMTGMWCDPLVGRPEWLLLGAGSAWGMYHRFGQATPRGAGAFTVYRYDHWLFEGTGLRYGDLLGARDGVVGYETVGCRLTFDDYQLPVAVGGDGTPADLDLVAFCPSSNLGMGEYPASISALNDQGDLEFIAARLFGRIDEDSLARCRHGNAVLLTCRPSGADGGEVVTIGSTDWVFGLAEDPAVARVTRNVLERHLR